MSASKRGGAEGACSARYKADLNRTLDGVEASLVDVVIKHSQQTRIGEAGNGESKTIQSHFLEAKALTRDASPLGTFNLLPGEMRLHVLSFLPVEDLIPVSRLNKCWHELVEDDVLWKMAFAKCWKQEVQEEEEKRKRRRKEHLEREYKAKVDQLDEEYRRKKQQLEEEYMRKKKKLKKNWKDVFENHFLLQKHWESGKAWVDTIEVKRVVNCVLVDEDKDLIVCGNHSHTNDGQGGEINLWSLSERRCLKTISNAHDRWVRGVFWDTSNKSRLFSCSNDKTIKAWDVDTGNLLGVYEGHSNNVPMVQVEGNVMISCSRDQTVKIWDVTTKTCIRTLTGHAHAVNCVQFNGDWIVSGDREGNLRIWDKRVSQAVRDITTGLDVVHCMEFNLSGRGRSSSSPELIIGGGALRDDDRRYPLEIWDIAAPACRATLDGPTGFNWTMQCDAAKGKLVVGGADRTIRLWNVETGVYTCEVVDRGPAATRTSKKHEDSIYSVCMGPSCIVSGSKDHTVKIWSFAKERRRRNKKRGRRRHPRKL